MQLLNRLKNKPNNFRVVCFVDVDKKTFNPGLIAFTDEVVNEVVAKAREGMELEDRNLVINLTVPLSSADDIPSDEEFLEGWPEGFTYDPELIW